MNHEQRAGDFLPAVGDRRVMLLNVLILDLVRLHWACASICSKENSNAACDTRAGFVPLPQGFVGHFR